MLNNPKGKLNNRLRFVNPKFKIQRALRNL